MNVRKWKTYSNESSVSALEHFYVRIFFLPCKTISIPTQQSYRDFAPSLFQTDTSHRAKLLEKKILNVKICHIYNNDVLQKKKKKVSPINIF